eukprot:11172463-Lingulodinium_polyedra.AAC.1
MSGPPPVQWRIRPTLPQLSMQIPPEQSEPARPGRVPSGMLETAGGLQHFAMNPDGCRGPA